LIHNENPYGRNPTTFKNWSDGASVSSVEINPKEAGRKIYELRKSQNRRAATPAFPEFNDNVKKIFCKRNRGLDTYAGNAEMRPAAQIYLS